MDREAIARVIAETAIGIRLHDLMQDKTEWNRLRGEKNGYPRDINDPFQSDVYEAADQILSLSAARSYESERVKGLEEALQGLENACDHLAALRSRELYLAMIEAGQQDALLTLDEARRIARSALSAIPGEAVLAGEGNSSAGGRVPCPQMDTPTPSPAGGEG